MATEGGGGKEMSDIKTQFSTREGTYRLLSLSEYSRPNRVPFSAQGSNPVKVSFVNVNDQSGSGDRICFNVGRELYFYIYKGVRKAVDLNKPIDKRIYKGTQPTCHDVNTLTARPESVALLVGFSAGQVQLIDPVKKETSKLFNEERLIDKTRVTCLKWVPGSENLFVVSHASGSLYLYNEELGCGTSAPSYSAIKQGDGFCVYACKSKSSRNPLHRWAVGDGALNEFAFSPDGKHLACVGQDGFLRVFSFEAMELQGAMRSYFGGLLCVCWSPDGKYLVTGGEDDLVSVWSFLDGRVIARGHGHKSWVSVVAFDPYTTSLEDGADPTELSGSDEEFPEQTPPFAASQGRSCAAGRDRANSTLSRLSQRADGRPVSVTYRFGSVGQDTQLCLWDLTEDVLFPHQPLSRARTQTNIVTAANSGATSPSAAGATVVGGGSCPLPRSNSLPHSAVANANSKGGGGGGGAGGGGGGGAGGLVDGAIAAGISKFATLTLHDRSGNDKRSLDKEHKRNHSMGHISSKSAERLHVLSKSQRPDSSRLLGTPPCPRMDEVPLLEPLVCKKVAHERLTVLVFLEEAVVSACQEGFICTWARPGKTGQAAAQTQANSPSGTVV
ncbi:WD repeat-containing protein 20-like isoform X3 [Petromyzon marinus]|uniref:WD repeat-containing protein 20-like isoform X3 n=1 Tax=Petromyzon marinus TaxID=7757 RepID=UPI003F7048A8